MKTRRRAWRVLGWAAAVFVGVQVLLSAAGEWWRPSWRDREYGTKLGRLRDRLAEEPHRPLVLVLGSSRVGTSVRPERWRDAGVAEPLVFNAGVRAAGPMTQLLWLNRLLDDGVRPDWVVMEYWPPACLREEALIAPSRLGWRDGLRLLGHVPNPNDFAESWLAERLVPAYSNRLALLNDLSPDLVSEPDRWERLDATGWRAAPSPRDARHAAELLAHTRQQYRGGLVRYQIPEHEDRALRDALDLCRRRGIRTALLFMPEAKALQSVYPPAVSREVRGYLTALGRETGSLVFDCRDWLDDADFSDGYHLLPAAADRFSDRFARDVLPRLDAASARFRQ
jgi:hypothetical protein